MIYLVADSWDDAQRWCDYKHIDSDSVAIIVEPHDAQGRVPLATDQVINISAELANLAFFYLTVHLPSDRQLRLGG